MVSSFSLYELDTPDDRINTLDYLWKATGDFLVSEAKWEADFFLLLLMICFLPFPPSIFFNPQYVEYILLWGCHILKLIEKFR